MFASSLAGHRTAGPRTAGARTAGPRRRLAAATVAAALAAAGLAGLLHPPAARAASGTGQGLGADYDSATNSYGNEPDLRPDRIGSGSGFGPVWQYPTGSAGIGQVFARPVEANGTLVVATEENVEYGIDPTTGLEKWHTTLTADGQPYVGGNNRSWYFDTSKPIVGGRTCGDISPHVGVTSTPVVGSDGTVYSVAKVGEDPQPDGDQVARFEMHALDPATGREKAGWPVVLDGPADNAAGVDFEGAVENQRAALMEQNGVVYAAFASHCDLGLYRGWIIGVNTGQAKVSARWVSETGPNHIGGPTDDEDVQGQLVSPEGGVWQGGAPLVPDAAGTGFYVATGNGDFPTAPTNAKMGTGALGNAVVHLTVGGDGKLTTTDFYIPSWAASLNKVDVDLGSGGPTLLPKDFGTSKYPDLLVVGGKSGDLWLLDANHLNGFKNTGGDANSGGALSRINVFPGVVFGKISAYDGPGDDHFLYVQVGETLRTYRVTPDAAGIPRLTEVGRDNGGSVALGGSPLVTSVAGSAGSGVVWQEWEPNNDGTNSELRAYQAVPSPGGGAGSMQLIYSGSIGRAAKFQVPTVIDGWVYTAGRDGQVHAFHNPSTEPLTSTGGAVGRVVQGQSKSGSLTITAIRDVTVTSASLVGGATSPFSLGSSTPGLPAALKAGATLTLPFTFHAPSSTSSQPGQVAGSGLGYADVVDVGTSEGGPPVQFPLSGTAEYAQGHLAVNSLLALGDYAVGDDAQQPLTQNLVLSNDGATDLVIDHIKGPAAPFTLAALPADGTTLPSGGLLAITVSFSASTVQDYDDGFTFTWHATGSSTSNKTTTEVTASGVTPASVAFAPPPPAGQPSDVAALLDFGSVPVGSSRTLSFTLTNNGGAAALLSISKVPTAPSLSYQNPIPEGSSISGGESVSVPVTWSPTAFGSLDDSWTVDVGSGAGKQRIRFVGTAVAPVVVPPPSPTPPALGGGSGGGGTVALKLLSPLGSRGTWVWRGSVRRVNAGAVSLSGLANDTYSRSLSSVTGAWTVVLTHDGDRLDVKFGTLLVRLQRHGVTVRATVYEGSRVVKVATQRMSPDNRFRLDLAISGKVARVSLQKHGVVAALAPASGVLGWYASGSRQVIVQGNSLGA